VDVPEYKYTRRELQDNTYIMTGPGARPRYKSRSRYSRERKAGRIARVEGKRERERDSPPTDENAIPLGDRGIMAWHLDEELADAYEWSAEE